MKRRITVWFKPEEDHLPPLKTLTVIAFALLVVSMPLFAFTGGTGEYVREYFGLIWHFSMFFFIYKLPTPEWGKTCGTFWILLDVLSGILYINHFYGIEGDIVLGMAVQTGMTLCTAIRLAAHCFEGLWLISASCTTKDRTIKICGILAGILIAGYSIVSPFAPAWGLNLNVPFMLIWFVQIVRGRYEKAG